MGTVPTKSTRCKVSVTGSDLKLNFPSSSFFPPPVFIPKVHTIQLT